MVPVVVSANSRIMMVKVGMADLECGATTNNVARQKQVAFSNTFYVAEVRLMVRKDSGIKRIADLANKRVVTTLGTTADRLVKQAALANNITMQYLMGRNHAESMGMIVRGEADAYVGDDAIIAGERAKASMNDQLVFLDEVLATEPYGIMLPKDDPQFKKLVDDVIGGLMQSGEFARIYDKWFINPIPPTWHQSADADVGQVEGGHRQPERPAGLLGAGPDERKAMHCCMAFLVFDSGQSGAEFRVQRVAAGQAGLGQDVALHRGAYFRTAELAGRAARFRHPARRR